MPESYSLLEFVRQLANDDGLRADYVADPQGVLADHGLGGLAAVDVRDALLLVDDTRTVEFDPDHSFDPAPSFDPAADPDTIAHYFADYAGLPASAGFDLDGSDDVDDIAGYAVPAPQHADAPDDEPHTEAGFGHGVGVEQVSEPAYEQPDTAVAHHGDVVHAASDPASDPAFDEPGSYDEFGSPDTFDHPAAYDHPVDEPGHPH